MKTAGELKQDLVIETRLKGHDLVFNSTYGLFSPKAIDFGSHLLLNHISMEDNQQTLDLGCGYGTIGITLAKAFPGGTVDLVDKDFVAVEYAAKNIVNNRLENANAILSNAFSDIEDRLYHTIAANLPAKVGKELLFIMLSDARDHLHPGGQLVVVVINSLKEFIKRNFKELFGNCKKVKQGRDYCVLQAVRD